MYFSKTSILAVAALFLPAAIGTPISLKPRQNGVTCQTSGGSPLTRDVTNAINELKGRGDVKCRQTHTPPAGKSFSCHSYTDANPL